MSTIQRALGATTAGLVLLATGVVGADAAPRHRAPAAGGDRSATELLAVRAGLQVGPKHVHRPSVRVGGREYAAADPYLAQLRSGSQPDWSFWRGRLAARGDRLARARVAGAHRVPTPAAHDELEPAGGLGDNDTRAAAEHLTDVGIGRASQAVRVLGRLATPTVQTRPLATVEDQGSIPRATRTGIGPGRRGVLVSSRIGDGRHGSSREGTGDFDFYQVRALAGQTLTATTAGSAFDTVLTVYDRPGRIVAANDDDESSGDVYSTVEYEVPRAGPYYVMVSGFSDFGALPESPFHPASGSGSGDEGAYRLRISASQVDKDFYGVHLSSGDVLAGTLTGAATTVGVSRSDGRRMVTSTLDPSGAYPATTPLPGGGASFAYVAEQPGWYAVSVQHGVGAYRLLVETYRPGSEQAASGAEQTVYLDFDGARLNTSVFGGPGVSTLSPLRAFATRWGLTTADLPALVDAVVAGVEENVRQTLADDGLNPDVRVRVRDSRHDADPSGSRTSPASSSAARSPSPASPPSASRSRSTRATSRTRRPRWCCSTRSARRPVPRTRSTPTCGRAATGSGSSGGRSRTSSPTRWPRHRQLPHRQRRRPGEPDGRR